MFTFELCIVPLRTVELGVELLDLTEWEDDKHQL